jgi:hypothetical protein
MAVGYDVALPQPSIKYCSFSHPAELSAIYGDTTIMYVVADRNETGEQLAVKRLFCLIKQELIDKLATSRR